MNRDETNYTKLIQLIFLNNKAVIGLFQIATIIGITFLFSFTALTETIIQTKQDIAIQHYGKFSIVIPDISNTLEKDIKSKNPSFLFESFEIGGNIEYANKKITYGAMQEKMGDIFSFQLIKGNWPKNSSQIVMESYVAHLIGIQDKTLPVSIPLTINGQTAQYDVTGIISNYSYTLTDYYNSDLETKAYPSILFNDGQLKQSKKSLVILQKKLNLKTFSDDIDSILLKEYKEDFNQGNLCENDILQFYGYDNFDDMIKMEQFYRLLLNVLLIFVFIIMIKVILTNSKKMLFLFEAMGLTKKKERIIVLGTIGIIILIGLIMGSLFSLLFGLLYLEKIFLGYCIYYYSALLKNLILECIVISIILLLLVIGYRVNWKESIIYGLSATDRKTKIQKYCFKKIDFYIVIMQAICLFFIIASMNFVESFHFQEKEITYDLYSQQMCTFLSVEGYDYLKNPCEYFKYNDIDALKKYTNSITFHMYAWTNRSSILIDKDQVDDYWNEYCQTEDLSEEEAHNDPLSKEKKEIWNKVSAEACKYKPVSSSRFHVLVLPQEEFQLYLKENSIHNTALEENKDKGCILSLPNYTQIKSDVIQKGDNILLGRIKNDNDTLTFVKESFQVEEIINGPEDTNQIEIIISEDVAKKSKLIIGFETISITLKEGTSPSIQNDLDDKFTLLMASVQGGKLYSSITRNNENLLMDRYTSILSNSLIFFCLCAICIYILMNHYIEWEKYKFEYGVLRSFGMSYSSLQHKLFFKYSNSILLASIISIIIGNMAFPNGVTIPRIVISLVITFSITYICRIVAYYRNRNKPVSSMLNKN